MEEIKEMFKQIKEKIDNMDKKLENVIKENEALKKENAYLREQNTEQEERLEHLEREIRKNNIIIKGIQDKENEHYQETQKHIQTIMQKLGVEVDLDVNIEEIRRVGRYTISRNRPILVKLIRYDKTLEILRKSKALKGTNVWIEKDYSKKVQEERKALIPQLKEARQKGYMAYLKHNVLVVNKEVYHARNLGNETREADHEDRIKENYKRTINDRSPENNSIDEQKRKIKNAKQKN